MQNALNRKFNLNSYFNGKSANTIKSLLCFAPLSVIPTPQMCLHCWKNREVKKKQQLLLSFQCLESIYCNTWGSSQHSSGLLKVVWWHTCFCARLIVTGAGTTHTNSLHALKLSEYTSGGLSIDKSTFTTFFYSVNTNMLKRLAYRAMWAITWLHMLTCEQSFDVNVRDVLLRKCILTPLHAFVNCEFNTTKISIVLCS